MENPQQKNKPEIHSDLESAWDLAGLYQYKEAAGDDAAWESLRARLHQQTSMKTRTGIFRSWKIAAATALLAGAGAAFWAVLSPDKVVKEALSHTESTRKGEIKKINLPDGSTVVLNSNSSLEMGAGYGTADRKIRLQGQAYFEVSRNEKLPFEVSAGKLKVTVLGTGFDVRAYNEGKPTVRVAHGRVKVSNGKQDVLLTEGMAVESNEDGELVNAGDETVSWLSGNLIFRSATMTEIAEAVKNRFGITLDYPATEANRQFTGKFQAGTSGTEMASILSQALNIQVTVQH